MWKVVLVQLIDLDLNKIAEGKTDAKGSAPAKLGVSWQNFYYLNVRLSWQAEHNYELFRNINGTARPQLIYKYNRNLDRLNSDGVVTMPLRNKPENPH